MRISLVIAAHNEESRIATCLASVVKAVKEYGPDVEVIVVANACTDRTAEIVRGFEGVRLVEEPRKGLSRARDSGFRAATGDLVGNLDADVIVSENWLPFAFDAFARDPKLVALSGPIIYYDLSLVWQMYVRFFYFLGYFTYLFMQHIRVGSMLQGGNFVVRRSALEKIGGFNTSIQFYGEDTDMARRLSQIGKIRWTFKFPMKASGRRLKEEGLVRTGFRYAVNYLWTIFLGAPYNQTYTDIRTDAR